MDDNLIRHLNNKNIEKVSRQKKQTTKEYKAIRISKRYTKFAKAHRDQLDKLKTGAAYETIIAVKVTKNH